MEAPTIVPNDRRADIGQERIVGKYLKKYFYDRVFDDVEVVFDTERQLSGIDVVADGMLIDNKAQSSPKYVNHPRDTFILELSILNKDGEVIPGWFIDTKSRTTHYLFVWIGNALVDDSNRILPRGINEVEVMLVSKSEIMEKIISKYPISRLLNIANRMREFEMKHYNANIIGCKFSHSPQLKEKPVNIVTRKDFLKQCATLHCRVTPEGIVHI